MIPKIYRVSGNSLHPRFQHGDFVLVSKFVRNVTKLNIGDPIVFRHAHHGTMIKLVSRINFKADEIEVVGNDYGSTDSRSFGPISKNDVLGKVIFCIPSRRPS
jgi:signal peptidase I